MSKMFKDFKVIEDQVIDLGTITELNEEEGLKHINEIRVKKQGCSFMVIGENENLLVGRNYDLTLSFNPLFKYILNINKYKAIGFSYTNYLENISFDEVVKNGIPEKIYNIIPFFGADYLNEKGLYMSANIRGEEFDELGKPIDICTGTNPTSNININALSLITYVTTRCSDIQEVLELVKKLNILTPSINDMIVSFNLVDAKGNYGVLEIARNKLVWLDKQRFNTNYFLSDEFKYNDKNKTIIEKWGSGYGRAEILKKGINEAKLKSPIEILKYMENNYYSNCYNESLISPFDIRSEYAGYIPLTSDGKLVKTDDGKLDMSNMKARFVSTSQFLIDDKNKDAVMEGIKLYNEKFCGKSKDEIKKMNCYWVTVLSMAVDCKNKKMFLHFWENNKTLHQFSI